MRCFKYSTLFFITILFCIFNVFGSSVPKKDSKDIEKQKVIPPRAEITLHGSSTLYSILEPHIEEIEKKLNFEIHLISANSVQGVHALYNNEVDIAMISSNPKNLAEKVPGINVEKFLKFAVGDSRIVFIVNKNNPVKHAKEDELKWILSGKITNWKKLLGEDEDILVVMEYPGSGVRNFVEREMLLEPISIPVKSMGNSNQVITIISKIKYAIGVTAEVLAKDKNVDIVEEKKHTLLPFYFLCKNRTKEIKELIDEIRKLNIGGNIADYIKAESSAGVNNNEFENKSQEDSLEEETPSENKETSPH